MSSQNIHQVADFSQLKQIVTTNMTVIIGMVCYSTSHESKVMIKKFLKRKSELYPLIQFVYMDLSVDQVENASLSIIPNHAEKYPIVHHIRDGNNIVCTVPSAIKEDVYESFEQLAKYYKKEMLEFQANVEARGSKSNRKSKTEKRASRVERDDNATGAAAGAAAGADSESEIEMEDRSSDVSNRATKTKPHVVMEDEEQNATNADQQITPQIKAALDRQKFKALEKRYGKLQKGLYEEIKIRMRIEKEEAEEEAEKQNRNTNRGDKDKTKRETKERVEKPPPVKHDQVGHAKGKAGGRAKSKSKSRARRR